MAPAGDELIVSQGVIGRFGGGHTALSYWARGAPRTFSLDGKPVVFIFAPVQGTAEGDSRGNPPGDRSMSGLCGTRKGAVGRIGNLGVQLDAKAGHDFAGASLGGRSP